MSDQSAETPEPMIQEVPQQGFQVDPQRVIESLLRQNSEQTRQIAHLEAFLNQQQEEKMELQRQLQGASSHPAEVEHNGRVTESSAKPRKKKSHA